jgi:acyl dehydratase
MPPQFWEDFAVGKTIDLGSHEFTTDSIIAFAREFDPQPMHTNADRARESMYGGLIASGWHTASVYMRLLVDGVLVSAESLGSPGVESLRWLKPVRPGDVLSGRITVLDSKPSRSRPEWGIVRSRGEMINQHGEVVMQLEATNFFARRSSEPAQ